LRDSSAFRRRRDAWRAAGGSLSFRPRRSRAIIGGEGRLKMIGGRIRGLREARAWTQAHLADAAGVSLRTIQRLESVHSCSPETLLALAAALEIDVRLLAEERALAPPAWRGPSPRAAALWGGMLALPCVLFVAVNLLNYGAGIAAPYDALADLGGALGVAGVFHALSPFLLLAAPLAAILLNLAAMVRPRIRWDGRGGALTAVDFRFGAANLAILLAAGGGAAILAAYLVSEYLGHLVRGAL
jgi:DNA-binding XRE family transcriptional regulator